MKSRIWKPFVMVAMFAAMGAVVLLLWNFVVPAVIGWGALNYVQALCLVLLSRILFGGWGGARRAAFASHSSEHRDVRNRIKGMSREEKMEYIRQHISSLEDGTK